MTSVGCWVLGFEGRDSGIERSSQANMRVFSPASRTISEQAPDTAVQYDRKSKADFINPHL